MLERFCLPLHDNAYHCSSPSIFRTVLKCCLVKFGGLFNDVVSNSAFVTSNVRMTGKWWIGKYLEGNNCSVFEEFFGDFPGTSEFNHQKPQDSWWLGQNTKSHWTLIVFSEWQDKIYALPNYHICTCTAVWTVTNLITGEFLPTWFR